MLVMSQNLGINTRIFQGIKVTCEYLGLRLHDKKHYLQSSSIIFPQFVQYMLLIKPH